MKYFLNNGIMPILLLFVMLFSNTELSAQRYSQQASMMKTPPRGSRPIYKDGAPCIVSIIRSDIKVRGSVQYNREGALELWSSFYVYGETQDYYYIGYADLDSVQMKLYQPVGWVEKQYLLDNAEALRTQNKIYRRVIVFDNKQESRIPIFSAPSHDSYPLYKTPLFSFFYVYKETEDYYLIGVSAKVNLEDIGQDILGWIHKKSSREWNTRLAVHYKEETQAERIRQENETGNGLVKIYDTLEDAIQQNNDKVISKETPRISWEYNMVRYPLLENTTEKQKRLFQIAFLSGKNGEVAQQNIARIKEQKERIKKLDIMFLMDSSLSPDARIKVQEALQKTKTWLSGLSYTRESFDMDVTWGLSFFHSFDSIKSTKKIPYKRGRLIEPNVIHINDFTTNIEQLIRILDNEPFQGYRYEPKSLYYALDMMGHSKIHWREGSTRCVIVLSATGNNSSDAPDITQLTLDDVKETLEKNSIRVYGVQFEESASKRELDSVCSYGQQIIDLTEKMSEGGYMILSPLEQDFREKTFSFTNFFRMILEQYQQETTLFSQSLNDLGHGFPVDEIESRYLDTWNKNWESWERLVRLSCIYPAAEKAKASRVIPIQLRQSLEKFIHRHNIDMEALQTQGIFYNRGWVWEFNPVTNLSQIQVSLLIDQMELSRLIGFLSSLLMQLRAASKPEQYVEIWKTLLKATFGIDTIPSNEPLDNLILQHTGLPFMNGLLNYTLDDFVQRTRDPNFRRTIINNLESTCNRLFLVLQEKEQEQVTTPQGITITQTKRRWWAEAGSDFKYAWLEIEVIP